MAELETGPPEDVAIENARRKAAGVAFEADSELVLGVDTAVALDGQLYGKPAHADHARATLNALSGRRHAVVGGLCLIGGGRTRTAVATTLVQFRPLDEALIDWYLASDEWHDRAGAYAIQSRGAALVETIDGDYFNIVGLPVATLLGLEPGLLS